MYTLFALRHASYVPRTRPVERALAQRLAPDQREEVRGRSLRKAAVARGG